MSSVQANEEAVYNNPSKLLWIGLGKVAVGLFMLGAMVYGAVTRESWPGWWEWLFMIIVGGMFATFAFGLIMYGLFDLRERGRQGPVLVFTEEGLVLPNGAQLPWDRICDAWIYSRAAYTNLLEEELNIVWLDRDGVESTFKMHTLGLTLPAETIAQKILARIQSRAVKGEGQGAARWVGD